MRGGRCPSLTHVHENPTVRYCSECGQTVNVAIPPCTCSPGKHAMERWNHKRFCCECGEQVLQ